MRKYLFLVMILSVAILSGCGKEEQMPDFIPTNLLEDNTDNNGKDVNKQEDNSQPDENISQDGDVTQPDDSGDNDNSDSKDTPPVVGKTTTMYVKLNQFGGYLNVRPTPSTDKEPVGFLVHAEAVEVIEIKDGWASILYKGNICYVNDDYLVDKQPSYLEPPTITPKPTATPTPKPAAEDAAAPSEEELPDEI